MAEFEEMRQRIFQRLAEENLDKLDPETGMPAPVQRTHPTGAHSMAAGSNIRSTAEAATALAMAGYDDLAWKALSAVLDHQDTNPRSFTYGNFFWYTNWKTAFDPNAVSFITPCLCYLLRHRGQDMPESLRRRLSDALALAVDGLNAHRATWGYTNIAILNMASKLLIGDVLDDPRARDLTYWDWEEWRNHTARLGAITEYNSLGYTTVQIHGLAMMLTCRADERFLKEVRMAMRHLITACVLDYHPAVGRITGPQSRAYEGDRRMRGRSGMDTVLHFVLGTKEPVGGCHMWLGAPIGPQDLLVAAEELRLPRTTRASADGLVRTNYLAPDFALGSISGGGHSYGHATPFFLGYRTASERCTICFTTERPAESHFSHQRRGSLLAGSVWLLDAGAQDKEPNLWQGSFTRLATGRPENLIRDPDFRPGYDVELGLRGQIRIFDATGTEETNPAGTMPGTALAVETESVCVGLRFVTAAGQECRLALREEAAGETVLRVQCAWDSPPDNRGETAVFCGFLLWVMPRSEGMAPRMAPGRAGRRR